MTYILESSAEVERLERQEKQHHYNLSGEIDSFEIVEGSKVLDAGCGSGLLSRYLAEKNPSITVDACDFSELRVRQAEKMTSRSLKENINFFQSSLEDLKKEGRPLRDEYDLIFCRYVYEYLDDPISVSKSLLKALRPNGTICLIDVDGIFLNFYTKNETLNNQLSILKKELKLDLYVGRKLPVFLEKVGVKEIQYNFSSHAFLKDDRVEEIENTRTRLDAARPALNEIFQEAEETDNFINLYLNEMKNDNNPLFHSKFVVWGKK